MSSMLKKYIFSGLIVPTYFISAFASATVSGPVATQSTQVVFSSPAGISFHLDSPPPMVLLNQGQCESQHGVQITTGVIKTLDGGNALFAIRPDQENIKFDSSTRLFTITNENGPLIFKIEAGIDVISKSIGDGWFSTGGFSRQVTLFFDADNICVGSYELRIEAATYTL